MQLSYIMDNKLIEPLEKITMLKEVGLQPPPPSRSARRIDGEPVRFVPSPSGQSLR